MFNNRINLSGQPQNIWQKSKGTLSPIVFCLYFFPLVLAFLLLTAFPHQARVLLALFSVLACGGALYLIAITKSLPEKQLQNRQQEPRNDESEKIYALENSLRTLQSEVSEKQEAFRILEEEKERLTKALETALMQPQETVEETAHKIQTLDTCLNQERAQFQQEKEALHKELQHRERLLAENSKKYELLKNELENTRFELDTLLKLEVRQNLAKQDSSFTRHTTPPSLFADTSKEYKNPQSNLPPSLQPTSFHTSPRTAHDTANTILADEKMSSISCDQELLRLLEKTRDLAKTSHAPGNAAGQQLELPHFLDLSIESLAIEKRRLFDAVQQESELPAFIMNCQDAKILFVSAALKKVGIAPELFQREFFSLVGDAREHIKNALTLLKPSERTKIPIQLRIKPGVEIRAMLAIGVCPLPPFSRSAIGILEIE